MLFRVLLYTRNRIEAVNMISSPSFAGFWQEWFPVPQSITAGSENVNGVIYQVYEIRKAALFASESGTLTIPALQFELQMADPASMFFGSTPAAPLDPGSPGHGQRTAGRGRRTAGRPIRFFASAARMPRADINDIVTLHMKISGSGNSKAIIPPALPSDEQFLVYPAKITQENDLLRLALTGTLRAEIPVSFNKAGAITFPVPGVQVFRPGPAQHRQPAQPPCADSGQRRKTDRRTSPRPCPGAPSCKRARTSISSRAAPP